MTSYLTVLHYLASQHLFKHLFNFHVHLDAWLFFWATSSWLDHLPKFTLWWKRHLAPGSLHICCFGALPLVKRDPWRLKGWRWLNDITLNNETFLNSGTLEQLSLSKVLSFTCNIKYKSHFLSFGDTVNLLNKVISTVLWTTFPLSNKALKIKSMPFIAADQIWWNNC